jgi:hypothetical protein
MQITGGKVSFRRVVQPAQYESKEGNVELSFVVAEGEGDKAQAFLDATAQMAQAKALELVGLKPVTSTAKPDLKVVETPPSETAQKAKDEAKAKAAAKLNAKDKPKGDLDGLDDPKPQITKNPEDRKPADELAGLDTEVLGDPDGLDTAPKEITDTELRDAVSAWVNKNKNAGAVKELRSKFAGPPPKGLNDIPQAKRQEFLEALGKLPTAAAAA